MLICNDRNHKQFNPQERLQRFGHMHFGHSNWRDNKKIKWNRFSYAFECEAEHEAMFLDFQSEKCLGKLVLFELRPNGMPS